MGERNLDGHGGTQRQEAGGLSAQRRVLMTLLFWSLPISPPPLETPYPRIAGGGEGVREREERSGASVPAREKAMTRAVVRFYT